MVSRYRSSTPDMSLSSRRDNAASKFTINRLCDATRSGQGISLTEYFKMRGAASQLYKPMDGNERSTGPERAPSTRYSATTFRGNSPFRGKDRVEDEKNSLYVSHNSRSVRTPVDSSDTNQTLREKISENGRISLSFVDRGKGSNANSQVERKMQMIAQLEQQLKHYKTLYENAGTRNIDSSPLLPTLMKKRDQLDHQLADQEATYIAQIKALRAEGRNVKSDSSSSSSEEINQLKLRIQQTEAIARRAQEILKL